MKVFAASGLYDFSDCRLKSVICQTSAVPVVGVCLPGAGGESACTTPRYRKKPNEPRPTEVSRVYKSLHTV